MDLIQSILFYFFVIDVFLWMDSMDDG